MCGIAGYCINPTDTHINARRLAQALLLGIEERGKDATGAAWRDRNGRIVSQKRAVKATDFIADLSLDKRASLAVLHTRMWTQGHPSNPLNNHPIIAGSIVGVHNGTVGNDDYLMRKATEVGYKQQGDVDSEAIFATLDRVGTDKFSLTQALELPEARMALAWLDLEDEHDNTLHLARGDGSPLVVAQTPNGSLIFASTESAIKLAAHECGIDLPYMESVKEGTYFRVRDGRIAETASFFPTPQWSYGRGTYVGTGTTAEVKPQIVKDHTYTTLDLRFLDFDTDIPEMTASSFKTSNPTRYQAVTKWLEDHAFVHGDDDFDESHAVFEKAAEYGAFLRPGMWVQTPFKDEWCEAQVYRVPKVFPDGEYILRVLVPYWDEVEEKFHHEVIFLARSIMDIDGPALHFSAGNDNKPAELTA